MMPRVVTAVLLLPLVLGALWIANPWPLIILVIVATILASIELGKLVDQPIFTPVLATMTVLALALPNPVPMSPMSILAVATILWALGLFGAASPRNWGMISAGYLAAPLAAILMFPYASAHGGPSLAVLALAPLWAGDTMAYLVGRKWGRVPLAPKISPKKSREGAVANLITCIATGALVGNALGVPMGVSLAIGTVCGTLGQAGDLFESWMKRRADLKDSGSLLPGHGGLLDRIDSMLFVVIPCLWILALN